MSRALPALLALPLLAGFGLPHAQGNCSDSYTVIRGDTLYSIARLCRSSVEAMARANRLASPAAIEAGQRLLVPGRSASVRTFREEVKEAPAPPPEPVREVRGHRMERGDTLYSLARWARVSLPALLAANPGIDPRRIEIGEMIRLPEGTRDPAPVRPRPEAPAQPPIQEEGGSEPDTPGM